MKKRLIALLLTICMIFTMLPMGAIVLSAAENDVTITVVDKNGNKAWTNPIFLEET